MPKEYILKSPSTNDSAPSYVQKVMSWAKATNALHGLLAGILSDGEVSEKEAAYVKSWATQNLQTGKDPLVDALVRRLNRVFSDGVASPEELSELREIFTDYIGGNEAPKPTPLPLCKPPPVISFQGQCYCFTGTFAAGTRGWCQSQTEAQGARTVDSLSNGVTVLVIGSQVSAGWANQTYGRKIMKAVELRDESNSRKGIGGTPSIVAEDHWLAAIAATRGIAK